MSADIPTITLEIGKLENDKYPLRLLEKTAAGYKEKAAAEIDASEFDRSLWDFDPIEKFLEEPDESADFQIIGEKLYALISKDRVGAEWKLLKAAQNNRFRVQLDIKAEEVSEFPWELAYRNDDADWLAVDGYHTFFRRFESSAGIPGAAENPSILRLLIVVGAEKDDTDILPLAEVRKIQLVVHSQNRTAPENKLFHRIIDIDVLWQPNLNQITDKLKEFKPHIFHFIGHGGIDGDKAFLQLDTAGGGSIEWTHDAIRSDFRAAGVVLPRFVFINACRSQNNAAGESELSESELKRQAWSIGNIFRRLGVPAVLTMQADIGGEIAGEFSAAFYEALARLEPLDAALAAARGKMMRYKGTSSERDWAIPVLTLA